MDKEKTKEAVSGIVAALSGIGGTIVVKRVAERYFEIPGGVSGILCGLGIFGISCAVSYAAESGARKQMDETVDVVFAIADIMKNVKDDYKQKMADKEADDGGTNDAGQQQPAAV